MQHSPPSRVYYNNSGNVSSHYNMKEQYPTAEQCYLNPAYPNRYSPIPSTFWNNYQAQVQGPLPNPYLTITHLNYQPMGNHYPNTHTNAYRPNPTGNFYTDAGIYGFTTNAKASSNLPCEEDVHGIKSNVSKSSNIPETTLMPEYAPAKCPSAGPLLNPGNPDLDVKQIIENLVSSDSERVTRFIVDSCLKAEAIAGRNQYRPCFKNIQNLCSKTRLDILKPRNTAANIHSQGIPWVTKDLICAFVRLVNTWYTLKGYVDERNDVLGKIESTLTPEFKNCYYEWEVMNKKMISHLAYAFVTLDYGVTVQNAKIYTAYKESQQSNGSATATINEKLEHQTNQHTEKPKKQSKATQKNDTEPVLPKLKKDTSHLRGIIRLKDIFYSDDSNSDEETGMTVTSDSETVNFQPEAMPLSKSTPQTTDTIHNYKNGQEKNAFWQAVDKISTLRDQLCENMEMSIITNDILAPEESYSDVKGTKPIEEMCDDTFFNGNSFSNKSTTTARRKEFGLTTIVREKFEDIITALMDLKLVRFILSAYDKQEIPEKYKYIGNPIHLLQIKQNLIHGMYLCPEQVVYDLKSVLNEAKALSKEKPEWRMGKNITTFSKELEFQLSEKFPTFDFSDIIGETPPFLQN